MVTTVPYTSPRLRMNGEEKLERKKYFADLLDIGVDSISTYEVDELDIGPLDNAWLRRFGLKIVKGPDVDLFAKTYEIDRFDQETKRLILDRVTYQRDQSLSWKKLGIPTPRLYGVHDRLDYDGSITLLYEFLSEPSHDINIIALNNAIKIAKKRSINPVASMSEKLSLEKVISQLEYERTGIVDSGLRTISELQEKLSEHKDGIRPPEQDYFVKRLDGLLKCAVQLSVLHNTTLVTMNDILNNTEANKTLVSEFFHEFDDISAFLLAPLNVRSKSVPTQADEYPHHFKFGHFDGEVRSWIFDTDRTTIYRPELAKAKFVSSFLLGFDSLKANCSFERSRKFKFENLRDFNIICLYELLTMMGRGAQQELFNRQYYDRVIGKSPIYSEHNHFVQFPDGYEPRIVSLEPYIVNNALPVLYNTLLDRIDYCLTTKDFDVKDKEKRLLERLRKLSITRFINSD